MRLTRIDPIQRSDHRFLDEDDDCSYLGEFTARQGFKFSQTNKQIFNLKIPPSRTREQHFLTNYKNQATNFWGNKLREAASPNLLRKATWIPIPCSKLPNDPNYDNRLEKVLRICSREIDVRNLIKRIQDQGAAHLTGDRPTPESLVNVLQVDSNVSVENISEIIIFDDVITRGASFKATQSILKKAIPNVSVKGIFLARTVHLDEINFDFDFDE